MSPRLEKIKKVVLNLEAIGLAVGLIVAWWHGAKLHQTQDSLKKTEAELSSKINETKKTLDSVHQTMSTRSLGPSPDFITEVQKLVDGAKRDVEIACDFAAYGEFDGQGVAIRQAIENRIRADVSVRLTVLSASQRRKARKAQFPEATWASSIAPGAASRDHILAFLARHGVTKTAPTHSDLLGALERYDELVARQMFRGADIRETDVDMPLLFWIADGKRAVMVVQTYGGVEESAFWTADPNLIAALQSIGNRYRQNPSLQVAAAAGVSSGS